MTGWMRWAIGGFWLGALTPALAAEPLFDEARLARVTTRMEEFVAQGQMSGAVTLVATSDQVVHLSAVGKSDVSTGRDMTPDTIFRIASLTKTITATALMLLVEEGRVGIDDPVAKYLPAFQDQHLKDGRASRQVTVRDVLTHTAGLVQPDREKSAAMSLAEVADAIGRAPLEFEPGSKWQYSSGLTVAGRIVEIVAEQEFAAFCRQRIFQPLGMVDTGYLLTPEQAQRLAATYKPGTEPGTLAAETIPDPTMPRAPGPSGGLYSTAGDLAKFYQAILHDRMSSNSRILPAKRVQEMTAPLTPGLVTGFTPGNAWGLGWCIVEQPQGVTRHLSPGTFGHGGAWGTQAWVDPQRGLIVILMFQRMGFGNSDGSNVRDAFNDAVFTAYRGETSETARFEKFGRYPGAVRLSRGRAQAALCPEAGGRVLEFSLRDRQGLYLDPQELADDAGKGPPMTAGRFDVGPELTIAPHPTLWGGPWTAEITGPHSARMVSPHDAATGLQLIRDFTLEETDHAARLICRQTMCNVSSEVRECCHWGRSFSPGGGVCVIPLAGKSKFPSRYAMYEDSAIINVRNVDDQIRERDGCLEILSPPRKPKLGFDSQAGWLAYVRPDNTLFVKRFPTYPDRVYNEAAGLTLSVWYPAGPRIELEPIGPREQLRPGEVASFTEDWWLGEFPYPAAGQQLDLVALRKHVESLP
ncbi:MAG: serine hydrolase [Planctomycetaceae bacterium]|nr:serine hydrolase [Planctomycetaceae bacterium]